MKKPIRLVVIRDLEVRTVPHNLVSAVADTDGSEQHGFSQRPGEIEIRFTRRAGAACLQPFFMVPD